MLKAKPFSWASHTGFYLIYNEISVIFMTEFLKCLHVFGREWHITSVAEKCLNLNSSDIWFCYSNCSKLLFKGFITFSIACFFLFEFATVTVWKIKISSLATKTLKWWMTGDCIGAHSLTMIRSFKSYNFFSFFYLRNHFCYKFICIWSGKAIPNFFFKIPRCHLDKHFCQSDTFYTHSGNKRCKSVSFITFI